MGTTIKRILSLDGGGIRGYLTALLIQELDSQYQILSRGDLLFAGTSTGGLIALALAAGVPISTIVGFYQSQFDNQSNPNNYPKIFTSTFQATCAYSWAASIWDIIKKWIPGSTDTGAPTMTPTPTASLSTEVYGLWQSIYDDSYLLGAVKSLLSTTGVNTFGDLQNNGRSALVTTFALDPTVTNNVWSPQVIDSLPGSAFLNSTIIDAGMSTSAAPIYFQPYNHAQLGYCADGGLYANNPAIAALTRAIGAGAATLGNVAVLALGTGYSAQNMDVTLPNCTGANAWLYYDSVGNTPAFPLLNALFAASSAGVDAQAPMLLGAGNYARGNPATAGFALDDTSAACYQALTTAFQAFTNPQNPDPQWTNIVNFVSGGPF